MNSHKVDTHTLYSRKLFLEEHLSSNIAMLSGLVRLLHITLHTADLSWKLFHLEASKLA